MKTKKPARGNPPATRTHDAPVGLTFRQRSKYDWAGPSLGDAFRQRDYYVRMPAQRRFYALTRRLQKSLADHVDGGAAQRFAAKVRPQLAPCYTGYPSATFAVRAAVGLTGFLEAKARMAGGCPLARHLKEYLADPAGADAVDADPKSYRALAGHVVDAVETRLILEDLWRAKRGGAVEIYRVFAAACQDLGFRSVRTLVRAVILYGDLLPPLQAGDGVTGNHPLTVSLAGDIENASRTHRAALARRRPAEHLEVGAAWTRAVCRALARYLPVRSPHTQPATSVARPGGDQRFADAPHAPAPQSRFGPMGAPRPPVLFEKEPTGAGPCGACESLASVAAGDALPFQPESAAASDLEKAVAKLNEALNGAGGAEAAWHDMRNDAMQQDQASSDFRPGPIEGSELGGEEVRVEIKGQVASGEVFDRGVEPSADPFAHRTLLEEAGPLIRSLKRLFYPDLQETLVEERPCSVGVIDPRRLALAGFCDSVFRRHRLRQQPDRRGRPVLLVVCDGSGSLGRPRMHMLKLLTAALLESITNTGIQLIAGLYHDVRVRAGLTAPLVEWIHHPRKTLAASAHEATRAVAALPDSGSGGQSDALSLAYMIEEARRHAPGRNIYVTLITDCGWCSSFDNGLPADQEVKAALDNAYRQLGSKLHVTLVALDVAKATGFEDVVDRVIRVSDAELGQVGVVAARIASYVASCVAERRGARAAA